MAAVTRVDVNYENSRRAACNTHVAIVAEKPDVPCCVLVTDSILEAVGSCWVLSSAWALCSVWASAGAAVTNAVAGEHMPIQPVASGLQDFDSFFVCVGHVVIPFLIRSASSAESFGGDLVFGDLAPVAPVVPAR